MQLLSFEEIRLGVFAESGAPKNKQKYSSTENYEHFSEQEYH